MNDDEIRERLETAHQKIYDQYQWFAQVAPGVTPREEGSLARWWSEVDLLSPMVVDP